MKKSSDVYIKLVLKDGHIHSSQDTPIAAFVHNIKVNESVYFNFSHPDIESNSSFKEFKKYLSSRSVKKIFVNDKKRYKYFLNEFNLYDINLFDFIENGNLLKYKTSSCRSFIKYNFNNINQTNLIVPYSIHQEEFDDEVELLSNLETQSTDSYCFKFFNNIVIDTLFQVEKNGLKVDKSKFKSFFNAKVSNDKVYSEYFVYNPTGRPSNKFDNINYVALNKDNGCRESFISRYDNGKLLMIDFTGFHPYIVSHLVEYKVPDDETIYEHLAKHYYNVTEVDSNTLSRSKKLTMVNLYGEISERYLDIEYFKKIDNLKNKYWNSFTKNGYVETPIYKRKITKNHVNEPNKNKLFAYIIQAAETEYGISTLDRVIKYVKDKDIVPILYVYDSIVFDVNNDTVDEESVSDVVDIIKNNQFKIKIYEGNNYNELKLVGV